VYDVRNRDDHDPRDGLMHNLDFPGTAKPVNPRNYVAM